MGEYILVLGLTFMAFIIYMVIDNARQNRFQKNTKGFYDIDVDNKTLTVYKKHPDFLNMFHYSEYETTQTTYTKEEYVFTAATVGNVTVGGVDKIGGYKDKTIKTGKYKLSFSYDGMTSTNIEKIYLSDELLKEAKLSSSVCFYLKENYIEVERAKIEPTAYRMDLASPTVRSMLDIQSITDSLPSKEKCKEIINWLGTPLSQQFRSSETLTIAEKEHIYKEALSLSDSSNISDLEEANAKFTYLKDWNDSALQSKKISEKLAELKTPQFYSKAVDSFNQKDYETAMTYFSRCIDYKNSKEYYEKCQKTIKNKSNKKIIIKLSLIVMLGISAIFAGIINADNNEQKNRAYRQELEKTFTDVKIGSSISFGKYVQSENEKTPIQWTVIDKTEDAILLFSDKVLDNRTYGMFERSTEDSWDTCELRKWLNGTFLYTAFSSIEQEYIKESELNTNGLITHDKIFILSEEEFEKCPTNKRTAPYTAYAASKVEHAEEGMIITYFLRHDKNILQVINDGSLHFRGDLGAGIRPAIWIDISRLK